MKLQVLSDNRQLFQSLKKEHGLSIYLETEKHKCLLDTGASDYFIQNASEIEVYVEEIDYVFISHGHSDHIGGLIDFLNINKKAKVILSENALLQRFFSLRKGLREISANKELRQFKDRFVFVDSYTVFDDEIHVFPCNVCHFPTPKANKTLMKKVGDELTNDDFNHELVFSFGKDRQVVYTGCAHCGIMNILDSVVKTVKKPVAALIGGFHLLDGDDLYESEKEIDEIVEFLNAGFADTSFYTGHCTGVKAYSQMKQKLGSRLNLFYAGFTVNINI